MATTVTDPSGLPPVNQPAAAQPDPELARLRTQVEQGNRDLAALKARFTAAPQPAAQPQGQMSPAELAKEFYKDPVGHTANIARQVATELQNQNGAPQQASLIQLTRDAARAKDTKLFDKYQLEIEAAVDSVAPQFRTNPTVWDNAIQMVKGRHVDEIIAEKQAAAAAVAQPAAPAVHISQGQGPGQSSARPASMPASEELSQDEKRVARKLGITEDQYKAGKVHIAGQNDPVRDPVGKSSWDTHITFDSRQRRRDQRAAADKARRAS